MFSSTAGGGGLREGTVYVPSSSLLVVVGVAVPSCTMCICERGSVYIMCMHLRA